MSEYCPNCGSNLESGSMFCSNCGADVSANTHTGEPFEQRAQHDASLEGQRSSTFEEQHDPTFEDSLSRASATQGDTTFAAITHIVALLTWVIGPAIILVATDDEFTKQNARNALNWQIMFAIYMALSVVLIFVFIGFFLLMLIPLLDLIFCVLAAVKANDGEAWTYPATIEFV